MIYVMSDIHGCMSRFRSIMKQIDLQPEDMLYVLGDVIDRGPDGIRILRELMAMPNVRMTLGNHELMMLEALAYPEADEQHDFSSALYRWYSNGGRVTHDYLKHLRKTVRAEIFSYLDALPVNIKITLNDTQYKLTHAAPMEDYHKYAYRYDSVREFAVWKRYQRYDSCKDGYTVIFGHTPTAHYQLVIPMEIWHGDGLIGIDCGSAYPEGNRKGRLACLRLDDMKEFYSEGSEWDAKKEDC